MTREGQMLISGTPEGVLHHQPPQVTDAQQPEGVRLSPIQLEVVISSQTPQ